MVRAYTLKKRAEQQAETRLRIVEAAVDLHRTVGPAATTVSMVAERAGVQRHTFYAHFPDEWSLLQACASLSLERDPLPEAAAWRTIEDRRERLRTGLLAIYGWYQRNADLAGCVLRDAEYHQLVRETAERTWGPYISVYREVLGASLSTKRRAMLELALSFFTWRTLTREGGLKPAAVVKTMVQAIDGADDG